MKLSVVITQINEGLTGVKQFKDFSWEQMEQYLKEHGLDLVGKGMFARVYSNDHINYVYKVFDKDEAYLSFTKYCLTHSSKHLPVMIKHPKELTKFFKHSDKNNKFFVVKIEKLNHLSNEEKKFFNVNLQQNVFKCANFGDDVIIKDHFKPDKYYRGLSEYISSYPEYQFDTLFPLLVDIVKTTGFKIDITNTNFMKRDDGTIVVTDPIAPELLHTSNMFS